VTSPAASPALAALIAGPIAHRGLWSADGAPENSLAAFEAAARAGYGVELDVQLSADGEAMVFHDDRLERLTMGYGRLADRRAAELAALKLGRTDERLPSLAEALSVLAGRVPVLVELKVLGGEEGPLERRVAELLSGYDGPAGLLSFNPLAVAAFADLAPERPRGLNSLAYTDAAHWLLSIGRRKSLDRLEHAETAKADFLSLGLDMLPSPAADALRAAGRPVICWTVRSAHQWARVKPYCDGFMFEGWRP
jgi:glycerophosphoryl diester phosphodiesterase